MFYSIKPTVSKKTRDTLILVIFMLVLAMLVIGTLFINAANRDKQTSNALLSESLKELNAAGSVVTKLARAGGSFTTVQIASVREHLYAASRLLSIVQNIYGGTGTINAQAEITQALMYVSECEERLTRGQSIDQQLLQLRGIIETIGKVN
ncbi:MAG: hypothetical protein LBD16_06660 [Oscillospiraceae bacterium]|nr:hypothetical protein [Oscillospiraceae bacterium]